MQINLSFINERVIEAILKHVPGALLVLLAGWIIIQIIVRIERKILEKSVLDPAVHVLLLRVTRIGLWILLVIVILSVLGVPTAPLITALAAGGAAVALAVRDSLSNVAGGFILLVNHPFAAGDEIEVGGMTGVVDHIDLMTTHLHSYDNRNIIIPNSTVMNSVVVNASANDLRRVGAQFGISYDADIRQAKEVIRSVIRDDPDMRMEPEPMIILKELGDSALVLDVGVWCSTDVRYNVQSRLMEQVKRAFDREGIEIPYPHMDINVRDSGTLRK